MLQVYVRVRVCILAESAVSAYRNSLNAYGDPISLLMQKMTRESRRERMSSVLIRRHINATSE